MLSEIILTVVGQQSKKVDKLALHFTSTVTFISFMFLLTTTFVWLYNVQYTIGFNIHVQLCTPIDADKTSDMRVMCVELVFIFIIRCVEIHLIYYSIKVICAVCRIKKLRKQKKISLFIEKYAGLAKLNR